MAKSGRPKANIDWNKVNKYLQAQCNGTGIAGLLGIAPITLYRACERKYKVNFEAYSAQKKSEGQELLRGKQFQLAMEGNTSMNIWLGKQYLQQKDKQELTGKDGIPLISSIQIEIINKTEQVKKDDPSS